MQQIHCSSRKMSVVRLEAYSLPCFRGNLSTPEDCSCSWWWPCKCVHLAPLTVTLFSLCFGHWASVWVSDYPGNNDQEISPLLPNLNSFEVWRERSKSSDCCATERVSLFSSDRTRPSGEPRPDKLLPACLHTFYMRVGAGAIQGGESSHASRDQNKTNYHRHLQKTKIY